MLSQGAQRSVAGRVIAQVVDSLEAPSHNSQKCRLDYVRARTIIPIKKFRICQEADLATMVHSPGEVKSRR